jgi:hypothetical protein
MVPDNPRPRSPLSAAIMEGPTPRIAIPARLLQGRKVRVWRWKVQPRQRIPDPALLSRPPSWKVRPPHRHPRPRSPRRAEGSSQGQGGGDLAHGCPCPCSAPPAVSNVPTVPGCLCPCSLAPALATRSAHAQGGSRGSYRILPTPEQASGDLAHTSFSLIMRLADTLAALP